MKNDYTTNSHYLTYTFLFKRLGECNFLVLGMKGFNRGPRVTVGEIFFRSLVNNYLIINYYLIICPLDCYCNYKQ